MTTSDARKRNAERTPKWADLFGIDPDYLDQEHDMTSPTQRRHYEILGRLDALIDAMTPPTYTVETRTCRKAEPVDVTEEPPCGSQVTDSDGSVWKRGPFGWGLFLNGAWTAYDYEWSEIRSDAPVRLTTDADRERVGLPVEPAPADDGLAEWERELFRPATCCGKCPPIAGGGYDCTCEGNPRCEKADTPEEWHGNPAPDVEWDCAACGEPEPTWQHECPDVTEEPPVESCGDLHPEDHAAFCSQPSGHDSWHDTGDGRRWKVDTAPDVEPDEALAEVLYEFDRDITRKGAPWSQEEVFREMARVAREHISRNQPADASPLLEREREEQRERAEKAEADVERLTRERDEARERAGLAEDERDRGTSLRIATASHLGRIVERAEADVKRLTRDRDDLRGRVDELIRERGQAIERYKALRADVETQRCSSVSQNEAERWAVVLDRDDERAKRVGGESDA